VEEAVEARQAQVLWTMIRTGAPQGVERRTGRVRVQMEEPRLNWHRFSVKVGGGLTRPSWQTWPVCPSRRPGGTTILGALGPASCGSSTVSGTIRMRLACPGRRPGNQRSRGYESDEAN